MLGNRFQQQLKIFSLIKNAKQESSNEMHLHIKAAIIAMRKENTPSKLTYFHSLSLFNCRGLQVQVRNLYVSLLIIRKTGVKIIQGHHPLCSQEWHNYWIKLQTHFKKAATKTWQNAAIAMMMDGYCNFRDLKSVSATGT